MVAGISPATILQNRQSGSVADMAGHLTRRRRPFRSRSYGEHGRAGSLRLQMSAGEATNKTEAALYADVAALAAIDRLPCSPGERRGRRVDRRAVPGDRRARRHRRGAHPRHVLHAAGRAQRRGGRRGCRRAAGPPARRRRGRGGVRGRRLAGPHGRAAARAAAAAQAPEDDQRGGVDRARGRRAHADRARPPRRGADVVHLRRQRGEVRHRPPAVPHERPGPLAAADGPGLGRAGGDRRVGPDRWEEDGCAGHRVRGGDRRGDGGHDPPAGRARCQRQPERRRRAAGGRAPPARRRRPAGRRPRDPAQRRRRGGQPGGHARLRPPPLPGPVASSARPSSASTPSARPSWC